MEPLRICGRTITPLQLQVQTRWEFGGDNRRRYVGRDDQKQVVKNKNDENRTVLTLSHEISVDIVPETKRGNR